MNYTLSYITIIITITILPHYTLYTLYTVYIFNIEIH